MDAREVRREEEGEAGLRIAGDEGPDGECDDDEEKDRHQDAGCAFDAGVEAAGDNGAGGDEEQGCPAGELGDGGEKAVEQGLAGDSVEAGELAGGRLPAVGQRPAADHAVEGADAEHRDDRNELADAPGRRPAFGKREPGDGGGRGQAAATADQELGNCERDDEGEDADEVDEHEGATAILAGKPGEAPDVPEPDREADGCEQE